MMEDGGYRHYDKSPEGYVLNDTGIMGEVTESETEILFRNMEEELRVLISRYSMQTSDLEQLFLVRSDVFFFVVVLIESDIVLQYPDVIVPILYTPHVGGIYYLTMQNSLFPWKCGNNSSDHFLVPGLPHA